MWPPVVAAIAVFAFGVWMVSPRFSIEAPSVVDDWSAIARSGDQIESLVRLDNPERDRFRPGWVAWNYVQWHTFDAPRGLVGPNAWNLVRLLVFVVGTTLMTVLLLPRARGMRESVVFAGLAALPALTVLAVPKLARDLARFGPQEPLLVGGLALGGSLLFLAVRTLLTPSPVPRLRFAAYAGGGTFFWLVGAYHKEASLAAVPLVLAVLYAGRYEFARRSRLSPRRRRMLLALGLGVALPLAHVAAEVTRITLRGDLVYGGEVDSGRGVLRGLQGLWNSAPEEITPGARAFVVGAVILVLVATVAGRHVDVLALGALLSSALAAAFAAQAGTAVSRYYIPVLVLAMVAACLSLARLPTFVAAVGVLLVFLSLMPPRETQVQVRAWRDTEVTRGEIVGQLAQLEASGCVLAAAGLDEETTSALPILTALASSSKKRGCGRAYLVLPSATSDVPLALVCAPGRLEALLTDELVGLYECSRVRQGAESLLERHRFRSNGN